MKALQTSCKTHKRTTNLQIHLRKKVWAEIHNIPYEVWRRSWVEAHWKVRTFKAAIYKAGTYKAMCMLKDDAYWKKNSETALNFHRRQLHKPRTNLANHWRTPQPRARLQRLKVVNDFCICVAIWLSVSICACLFISAPRIQENLCVIISHASAKGLETSGNTHIVRKSLV